MKTVKFIMATALSVVMGLNSFAQSQDQSKKSFTTDTIKVSGSCGMCKAKIEKEAKVQGVSKATWDQKTQVLFLTYDTAKVKSADVQKKIAAIGYDTELYKADDKAFNSLPGCCKYERKK